MISTWIQRGALAALTAACAALGVCAVVRGAQVERERTRVREARAAADAATLREAGALGAHEATARELRAALSDADVRMREAIASAQRAVPGARVTSVITATTGPITAPDQREAGPGAAACGDPTPPPTRTAAPISDTCLLHAGDTGEVRADIAQLVTDAGASALVGSLSCWRMEPGPAQEILGGPLRLDVSRWVTARDDARQPATWALEVRAGLGTRGVEGGVSLYGRGRIGGWAESWWQPGAAPGESAWGAAGGVSLRVGRR